MTDIDNRERILVDGHVHLHRGCAVGEFLSSAVSNLRRSSHSVSRERPTHFVLSVVDAHDQDGYERLSHWSEKHTRADVPEADGWLAHPTDETVSLRFERNGEFVVVIRGYQIRTEEDIEVLAIGAGVRIRDAQPVRHVIDEVNSMGATAVIPWGFGKWLGRRGRIVSGLLDEFDRATFHLGDNSNRPVVGRRPRLFDQAESRGFSILPGSDPLPVQGECGSVGRAGFALRGPLDVRAPAEDLTNKLRSEATFPEPFVELEKPLRFLRNQLKMQFRKHGYAG